jgi:predicted methyltransferase
MKRFLALALLIILPQLSIANASALNEHQLTQILSHPDRPIEDSKRDVARLPAKIMLFLILLRMIMFSTYLPVVAGTVNYFPRR